MHKLTAAEVKSLGAGRHGDGGGLYIDRDGDGRSRWVFMWKRNGKRREMGLGSAGPGGVTLAKARVEAAKAREVVQNGGDPIEARDAVPAETAPVPTFGEVADAFVADLSPQWRNEKHRAQWAMTLKLYAAPLRPLPVDRVDTAAVLEVLKPIWTAKAETASRVRGRIERVLDAARAKGHRIGENPARWRGHLDHLLPKRQRLTRGHHAAMPYEEVPEFIVELRGREAVAALALEFLILTAARSGEVLGATWDEMDLDAKVWSVPASRMKVGREHRVPLTARAVEILEKAKPLRNGDHVFPGQSTKKPLSGMALEMLMRRLKRDAFTVHGFRSSFRDWAGEVSTFPREVAEAALAHTIGDATERAYRRGDALEKRRKLMDAWSRACCLRAIGGTNVRQIQKAS
jgi:integrase